MNDRDKFDCHIIKEMIVKNKLSINCLNQEELNVLIDYEMDIIAESEIPIDNSFLNLCLETLKKYENYDDMISLEDQRKIGEKSYIEFLHQKQKTTGIRKSVPTKTLFRYLIAAAVLLVVLTATVAAVWNPFVSWLKERSLLDVEQGEVFENDNGSFASDAYQSFSSIDEMEDTLDLHIEIFDHISVLPESIKLTTQGNIKFVLIQYKVDHKNVTLKIYLENAPYNKDALEQSNYQKQIINRMDWHIITVNDTILISFEDNYVYAITANSLNTILTLMEG